MSQRHRLRDMSPFLPGCPRQSNETVQLVLECSGITGSEPVVLHLRAPISFKTSLRKVLPAQKRQLHIIFVYTCVHHAYICTCKQDRPNPRDTLLQKHVQLQVWVTSMAANCVHQHQMHLQPLMRASAHTMCACECSHDVCVLTSKASTCDADAGLLMLCQVRCQ